MFCHLIGNAKKDEDNVQNNILTVLIIIIKNKTKNNGMYM